MSKDLTAIGHATLDIQTAEEILLPASTNRRYLYIRNNSSAGMLCAVTNPPVSGADNVLSIPPSETRLFVVPPLVGSIYISGSGEIEIDFVDYPLNFNSAPSSSYAQAVANGFVGTAEQYYAAVGNITEHNPINVMYPPSPLVAPTGDGVTDDYNAIQAILDYAWEYRCGEVYFPQGIYCVSKPLLLKTKYEAAPVPWWTARGVKIRGFDKATSRIYKTTNQTLTGINAEHVDGIDAVVILYDPAHNNPTEGTGTGCGISDMNLYNQSSDPASMVIGGDANERTEFKHLNIKGKQGIVFDLVYCSHFYDIVFKCDEKALYIPRGHANTFDRLFVSGGNNPYTIHCSYSHIGLIYGDDCTGAVFDLAGAGLYASSLGTESEKAQYIVKCDGYQNGSRVLISHLHFHRQTGDTDLPLSDCAVFYGHGRVKCDRVSILENVQLVGNSYISKTDETAFSFVADVGQVSYQKNYTGDNNPELLDSPSLLKEYKLRHIRTVTLESESHISFSTDENGVALNLRYMEINAYIPAVAARSSVMARVNGITSGYYDTLQGNTPFGSFNMGYMLTGGSVITGRLYAETGMLRITAEFAGYEAGGTKDGNGYNYVMNITPVSAITSFTTYYYKLPAGTVFVVKGIDA